MKEKYYFKDKMSFNLIQECIKPQNSNHAPQEEIMNLQSYAVHFLKNLLFTISNQSEKKKKDF